MKFDVDSFRRWPQKKVTLLGLSGVGKTWLSSLLRRRQWFHYSADYRIGKRYFDEPILDLVKQQAMQVPFLRELLRRDWIDIKNNIKVDDLGPVLSFVGRVGDPQRGGIELDDFTRWIFPRLFRSRIPRYEAIAHPHGYTVTSAEVAGVRDESDFIALLETAIARNSH